MKRSKPISGVCCCCRRSGWLLSTEKNHMQLSRSRSQLLDTAMKLISLNIRHVFWNFNPWLNPKTRRCRSNQNLAQLYCPPKVFLNFYFYPINPDILRNHSNKIGPRDTQRWIWLPRSLLISGNAFMASKPLMATAEQILIMYPWDKQLHV